MQSTQYTTSSVGRQILMAVSGFFLFLFVIVHLLGNLSVFGGPGAINSYSEKLHGLGPLLWIVRLFLLAMLTIHIYYGVLLTLENRAAKPEGYAVDRMLSATFSGRTVIWTGLLLLLFIIYHLLLFTFHLLPGVVATTDTLGRFDVFTMMVDGLRSAPVAVVYVIAMIILLLHLSHGIQSIPQSMGWNNDKSRPGFVTAGLVIAWILLIGYCSIPVAIFFGFLSR